MRILYLTPGCFDKGGVSRYSRYQVRVLRELYGVENVRVLSLLGPNDDAFEEPIDVFWHGSNGGIADKVKFMYQLISSAVAWKPAVIHSAHAHFAGPAHIVNRLIGAKSILNVYGIEVWSDPSSLVRYGLRKTDRIISDCHNTAEYVSSAYRKGVNPDVIWDCVDLNQFKFDDGRFGEIQSRYGLPDKDNHVMILSLGRLSGDAAYKGYGRLLEVFNMIHQDCPDARLIFAGKGDLIPHLQAQSRAFGIDQKVFFTGSITEEDLPVLYAWADIFSLVTDAGKGKGEGIPLTPLEAMACRTPVIVGNHDGSREAVFANENGFVIDPFDLQIHAQVLQKLILDKSLRNQMAQNAEHLAHIHFSYSNFLKKHQHFYAQLNGRRTD